MAAKNTNDLKNAPLPELLAPAGGLDALYAAVAAGADAVYLGGGMFNARIGAKNFTQDELSRAIYTAHENGVKVHITLNTLLSDLEIPKAADFAYRLHTLGADAFIIQDMGLARYLAECLPEAVLHASTQCACHNADGANFLKNQGFSRVVTARELSFDDLKIMVEKSDIEIEMFIHGAICVCRSGQCYMSSFIGRRSGNRGECAQPCRLDYRSKKYPLSLKDMCLARHIPEIISLGVKSLKIEGRMKSPEYVYGVTKIYRRLLDERRAATNEEYIKLKNIFSRDGFTDGYFTANKKNMFGVRKDSDKVATLCTEREIKKALDADLENIKILPSVPEININPPNFPRPPKTAKNMKKPKKSPNFGLRIVFAAGAKFTQSLVDKIEQIDYGDKYLEGIYFPLTSPIPHPSAHCGVTMPSALFDTKLGKIDALIEKSQTLGYKKCLVNGVSHILRVENAGFEIHGGVELNVYNSESVKAWREVNLKSLTLSCECLTAQVRDIDKYKIPCGVTVYGRVPLMFTETCRIGECEKCVDGCKKRGELVDRTGAKFPIFSDGAGSNVIYNSLPLCGGDKLETLKNYGVSFGVMLFTTEREDEVVDTIKRFVRGENINGEFTRGYLK